MLEMLAGKYGVFSTPTMHSMGLWLHPFSRDFFPSIKARRKMNSRESGNGNYTHFVIEMAQNQTYNLESDPFLSVNFHFRFPSIFTVYVQTFLHICLFQAQRGKTEIVMEVSRHNITLVYRTLQAPHCLSMQLK